MNKTFNLNNDFNTDNDMEIVKKDIKISDIEETKPETIHIKKEDLPYTKEDIESIKKSFLENLKEFNFCKKQVPNKDKMDSLDQEKLKYNLQFLNAVLLEKQRILKKYNVL